MGFLWLWRVGAALPCGGFPCCWTQALGTWASVVGAHELNNCDVLAQLLCGMWGLPRPGVKPVTLARRIRNHWTTREAPRSTYFLFTILVGPHSLHQILSFWDHFLSTWCASFTVWLWAVVHGGPSSGYRFSQRDCTPLHLVPWFDIGCFLCCFLSTKI